MATAAAANESRSDLINWVNDLLQLNIGKIEQVGTGAVLCQIMDSIYGIIIAGDNLRLYAQAMYKCTRSSSTPFKSTNM